MMATARRGTSAGTVRCAGAVLGAVTMLGGGWLAGGWWWVAAAAGAFAAIGAVADGQIGHAQVLAGLVLVAGVVAAGHDWYVVVLAAGTIGSMELQAAADRVTVVRPRVPDAGRVVRVVPAVALLAAAVLVIGAVTSGTPAFGAVAAAAAGVLGLRVIAR